VEPLIDVLNERLAVAGLRVAGEDVHSEERYRELVENASDIVYTHDLRGKFTSVNKAVQTITGYTRSEVLKLNLADILTPESLDLSNRIMNGSLGGGSQTTYEVTARRKDGRSVTLEVSARLLFRAGRPAGLLGIARDVSERRRSEGHLQLLRSVVVNANDAVLIAEAKPGDQLGGRIVYVNEAFSRMTGYSSEEATGRTPRILLGPQTDRDQLNDVRQSLSNSESVRVELINYRKDGSAYWVDVNFVPIKDGQGEFTHWVAVQRETTYRKREEDLERDRNRVLELVACNEPLESVLTHLTRMVDRQCPDLRCSVLLMREGALIQAAGASLPAGALDGLQELGSGAGAGAPQLGRYQALLPGPRSGVSWSVPILAGSGKVLGGVAITCKLPRKPAEDELDLIGKTCRLAAIAIEQRQLTDKLAYQAQHDSLTGLPNRVLFEDRLQQALAMARRQGWLVAVLFVDLDRFKQINDTLGHPVGDLLLQQVARRLENCIRRTDTLARMGGDEFTLLLTELRDHQYSLTVAQKLLDALKAPFHLDGYELFVTASVGISVYPRDGRDAATLQRNADSAMYRAKNQGKNNFQVFKPEISATALESLEIENALRRALENGEFQLRYQPQATMDGRLAGLEALLVWNHPKLGLIPPAQFIPMAEECGLIVPIGAWVLRQACQQHAEWRRSGQAPVKIAVNVSVTQFTRPGFVEVVAQVLKETGLDSSFLELEITESVVMRDVKGSAQQMERLSTLGVGLSIDDFGTGYSSLSYLRTLPIDTLKIDQSFLQEVDSVPNTMPLLRAIVALAHSLQLCVVAEGVEYERQLEALREVGCDRVQGYLIGEPMPAEATSRLLSQAQGLLLLPLPPQPPEGGKKDGNSASFTTG